MKKVRMFFIHGIHATRKPATSQLAPHVKQYFAERGIEVEIVVIKYGYALALPRFFGDWLNEKRAAKIAKQIREGDINIIWGHSNGTTLHYLIQKTHRHIFAAVLFQPALDNDVAFTGTDHVLVIYNEKDDVVEQSRLARFSSWGNMGREGYKGLSKNVVGWNSMEPPTLPPYPYSGHCGFVENGPSVLKSWALAPSAWIEKLLSSKKGEGDV